MSNYKYPIKIRVCEPDIGDLELKYVTEAIRNNEISSVAPPVRRFEEAFAKRLGMKYAVSVNSGGSALFLTLKTLGIGPGDEVIMPSFTMVATAGAASHCGATPVFVDSQKNHYNIDASKIEEKITPRTKAIIPVHIYGQPCDMDEILEIAKKHNFLVIEDAAEAHGAKYKGRDAGAMGIAGCFSFYANKILTTGEGGIIVTNDEKLTDRLRHMRGYDFDDDKHFWHKTVAWNLRMSALEAALGLAQLERLDELVEKRRANAQYYTENLKSIPELTLFEELPETRNVFWMYGILAPDRDGLAEHLAKNGIETRTFFIPMHEQPLYQELPHSQGGFHNASRFGKHGLYLPSSSHLTKETKDAVINAIKEFYAHRHK